MPKKRTTSIAILISLAVLGLFVIAGCDWLTIAEVSSRTSKTTAALAETLPGRMRALAAAASGLAAAIAAAATAIHQWRVKVTLKKAIQAKAAQIDRAKTSPSEAVAAAAAEICTFMKADRALHGGNPTTHLDLFDAVRKGLR